MHACCLSLNRLTSIANYRLSATLNRRDLSDEDLAVENEGLMFYEAGYEPGVDVRREYCVNY